MKALFSFGQEVGYIIRGESKTSQNTKITFVTTCVLLRRLQTRGEVATTLLPDWQISVMLLLMKYMSEALTLIFLLSSLENVLKKRKDLKLILMSKPDFALVLCVAMMPMHRPFFFFALPPSSQIGHATHL